jgi:hypothetical protein
MCVKELFIDEEGKVLLIPKKIITKPFSIEKFYYRGKSYCPRLI